jgi:catechol 2,3-dioxygenase-like lactoylglutathione lyase family enzyme
MAILTWLGVPGEPSKWESLGFRVEDGSIIVGKVLCSVGTELAWGFDAIHGDVRPLHIPTREKPSTPPAYDSQSEFKSNPNLIERIDHLVYAVPELDPAVDALTSVLGEPPKRRAFPRGPSGPEMAFFTVGDGSFIEVVASGRPPALWGIAFWTGDLDACVTAVREAGGPIGDPKPAVQGGRIASVWKEHVGWGVAVMEPPAR